LVGKDVQGEGAAPFGLEAMAPAFSRATRLAKALFGAFDASIILFDGDEVWRSRDCETLSRTRAPVADRVVTEGIPLWFEDMTTDPSLGHLPGGMGLKFFAGAPIHLSSGNTRGILCVVDFESRPFDAMLLARLKDIADGVADDCDRMRAIRAEHESAAEARQASEVMSAFIQTLPMGIVMTDREMRVIKSSPTWAAFFGKTEAEVFGKTIYEVSPFIERHREIHQRILAGESHEEPRQPVMLDGKPNWLQIHMMPWRDRDGAVGGMMVTTHNITPLVEAIDNAERSEQRLKMAIQIADLNIWELDYQKQTLEYVGDHGRFFEERPTYQAMMGGNLLHPEDQARASARMARRLAGERFAPGDHFETRLNRADGKEVWTSLAVEPVLDESGAMKKVIGVMQNITSRKQAELRVQQALDQANLSAAEARTAEQVLSSFVDTIPVSIIMTDGEMNILKASPHWARALGRTAEEIVGKSLYDIAPRLAQFKSGHRRALNGERIKDARLRIERADGDVMWLETDIMPWRETSGEIGGVLICAHNVTDMVEALDKVERSERRLKLAIQLADLHVWEVDFKQKTLDKVGEDTFFEKPITYEDVAEDFFCSVLPEDRPLAMASLERRRAGNVQDRLVCRANRTDGKEIWMSSAAEVFKGKDGNTERVVGVFQNITSMKRAERAAVEARDAAEAANRSKSEFLANMSHEIRTPLNGVLGMTQVIEQDELSETQRERVRVVRESGTALLAILNDVLDLSKIQAGKLELSPAPFDMAELAPVVAAAFEGSAASKDIALDLEIDESATGVWVGDVLRLRQVLSNLLSNGLKFTAQGRVVLSVRRERSKMRFSISDTGIGIDADKVPQLFEKFAQEDASTTRRYGGTGLGLSICRELVELMGGTIEVESEKGVGSTFSVLLPLKRGKAKALPAPRAAPEGQRISSDRAIRILAAEDNLTNQLVLRSLLAPLGVELTIAGNGRAAVESFRSGDFDIVLMDIQMPDMNGVEATQIIRDLEKAEGRSRTPVLALSANVMTHQISEYEAAGMDGCIAKPIEVSKLYQAIDEALVTASPGQSAAANAA